MPAKLAAAVADETARLAAIEDPAEAIDAVTDFSNALEDASEEISAVRLEAVAALQRDMSLDQIAARRRSRSRGLHNWRVRHGSAATNYFLRLGEGVLPSPDGPEFRHGTLTWRQCAADALLLRACEEADGEQVTLLSDECGADFGSGFVVLSGLRFGR